MKIAERLAAEFKIGTAAVARTLALLDAGAAIPFIARYRKEQTGGLAEHRIREIARRRDGLRTLEERRTALTAALREKGLLSPERETALQETTDAAELEDFALSLTPRENSRAARARDAGLEPLARWLVDLEDAAADVSAEAAKFINAGKGIETAEAALRVAGDILAEEWADDPEARKSHRALVRAEGVVVTSAREEYAGRKSKYEIYYLFRESIQAIPSHRALAVIRGEREKVLKIELAFPKKPALRNLVVRFIRHPKSAAAPFLTDVALDALDRILAPAVKAGVLREIREKAEGEAFKVFGENLRDLLMAAPAGRQAVLGVDPGFRAGCKLAVVAPTGKFIEYRTIYPNAPKNDADGAKRALLEAVCEHKIALVAVGGGQAGRETETFVRAALGELPERTSP